MTKSVEGEDWGEVFGYKYIRDIWVEDEKASGSLEHGERVTILISMIISFYFLFNILLKFLPSTVLLYL